MPGKAGMHEKLLRSPTAVARWRAGIKIGQIRDRLEKHALGKIEMSASQIRAAEVLLDKAVPSLRSHEVAGPSGGAVPIAMHASVAVYLPDNGRAKVMRFVEDQTKGAKP